MIRSRYQLWEKGQGGEQVRRLALRSLSAAIHLNRFFPKIN